MTLIVKWGDIEIQMDNTRVQEKLVTLDAVQFINTSNSPGAIVWLQV